MNGKITIYNMKTEQLLPDAVNRYNMALSFVDF